MADLSKNNTGWILLLIAAGVLLLALSLRAPRPSGDQGVVLSDIFRQQSVPAAEGTSDTIKRDPVPPMAIITSPVNGRETGFTIQVYSFQDRDRAQAALQSLKDKGYQAFLIMSDLGQKGIWWRVRVGGLADEGAAHKMLDEIRKNYNSGFIVNSKI